MKRDALDTVFAPLSVDQFFDDFVSQQPLVLTQPNADRLKLGGDSPRQRLLNDFSRYAPTLTSHARNTKAPAPNAKPVGNADEFNQLIQSYFDAGHTIRIPEVTELSEPLTLFTRALEQQVQAEVGVVVFWSRAGAEAPVHYDDVDVIVVQLEGTKRWFISKDTPVLPNKWKFAGEKPPQMPEYHTVDVKPGDLIYIPRGTPHTVQSTSESIHIAIGFVPVTIRDALNAVLDHCSDLNKPLRQNLGKRADSLGRGLHEPRMFEQVRKYLRELVSACDDDKFIVDALSRRKTRMIKELPKLKPCPLTQPLQLSSRVKHHPLAIAELTVTDDILDFCQPGEHILIHLGAQAAVEFIMQTPAFCVNDIPGELDGQVKVALVQRFVQSGFLTLAD